MSSKPAQAPFDWPAWLVEAAARDEPATELDRELLARLIGAGVTELSPAAGTEFIELAAADAATAIGAAGPGFAVVESLEGEPAQVAAALERLSSWLVRYDRLRALRFAAIDMAHTASTARDLLVRDGPARLFERVLETGLVVTYARPYGRSKGLNLGKGWLPKDPDDRKLHDRLIDELRNPYHAHNDRTPRRTLTDTTRLLGLNGPPMYSESWERLSDDELERLAKLAERQSARFASEADRIGAELGERRDKPSHPQTGPRVTLKFDHGIEAAGRDLRAALEQRRGENDAEESAGVDSIP